MSINNDEVFNIKEYLVKNNYPQGFIFMLEDYFINKAISKEEINTIMELPTDEYNHFINNYTLKGK